MSETSGPVSAIAALRHEEVRVLIPARHLVRVGILGRVGCFAAADGMRYPRRTRVVCRTDRGLEVGDVLAPASGGAAEKLEGTLIRRLTVQDDLLLARLERRKNAAFRACSELLARRACSAVLMDVEHLFDGQSLLFYFLGEISDEVAALTDELAEAYEAQVKFRKFTEMVTAGCGPDCGTQAGGGCGTSGCSSCGLAQACGSRQAS